MFQGSGIKKKQIWSALQCSQDLGRPHAQRRGRHGSVPFATAATGGDMVLRHLVRPSRLQAAQILLLCGLLHLSAGPCSGVLVNVSWSELAGRPLLVRGAKHVRFEPVARASDAGRRSVEGAPAHANAQQYIVRVQRHRRQQVQALLRDMLGGRHMDYMPMDSWVLAMTEAEVQAALELEGTYGVYKLPTALRVAPDLMEAVGRRARTGVEGQHSSADRVVLDVMLGLVSSGRSEADLSATGAERLAREWRQLLGNAGNEKSREGPDEPLRYVHDIRVASPGKVAVEVESAAASEISMWLAEQPQGNCRDQ